MHYTHTRAARLNTNHTTMCLPPNKTQEQSEKQEVLSVFVFFFFFFCVAEFVLNIFEKYTKQWK